MTENDGHGKEKRWWTDIATSRQASRAASIPSAWRLSLKALKSYTASATANVVGVPGLCGVMTASELDITESYDGVALLEKIKAKELTSMEVTTAFCKRAAIAQQLVNCCSELFFDIALERAKYCDEYLARTGSTIGSFHGLPISLKDMFHVPGVQTTSCLITKAEIPPRTEAEGFVKILHNLGAVFYVKTNMAQLGLSYDSDNNLYGRTLNPLNLSLTPGGSSGGESALITMRGSVLGVGTDGFGSLRCPAVCTGIFTIKPTPDRIPHAGDRYGPKGVPRLPTHIGPLCHSIRDAELFMQAVLNSDPWLLDPSLISVPYQSPSALKPSLRIGVITEDPSFPLHPPVQRAINHATSTLTSSSHTLIPLQIGITFPSLSALQLLAYRFTTLDTTRTAMSLLTSSGEPLIPSIQLAYQSLTKRAGPNPTSWKPSLESLIEINRQRSEASSTIGRIWADNDLDAIIMPGHNTLASPHDTWFSAPYLALWNLLPYPACIIPVGVADENLDRAYFKEDAIYDPECNVPSVPTSSFLPSYLVTPPYELRT